MYKSCKTPLYVDIGGGVQHYGLLHVNNRIRWIHCFQWIPHPWTCRARYKYVKYWVIFHFKWLKTSSHDQVLLCWLIVALKSYLFCLCPSFYIKEWVHSYSWVSLMAANIMQLRKMKVYHTLQDKRKIVGEAYAQPKLIKSTAFTTVSAVPSSWITTPPWNATNHPPKEKCHSRHVAHRLFHWKSLWGQQFCHHGPSWGAKTKTQQFTRAKKQTSGLQKKVKACMGTYLASIKNKMYKSRIWGGQDYGEYSAPWNTVIPVHQDDYFFTRSDVRIPDEMMTWSSLQLFGDSNKVVLRCTRRYYGSTVPYYWCCTSQKLIRPKSFYPIWPIWPAIFIRVP